MTTVITGATGVVGGAVLRHLISAGGSIRALVRPGRELPGTYTGTVDIQTVVGDILDFESLLRAFDGADLVYHVAGVNKLCLPDPTPMYLANVEGTRNVVRAARAAGVRRVVYTSSAVTIGEAQGQVGNEDSSHRGWFNSHYERSKFQAEQALINEAGHIDVVIVNPSSVQGPGRATGTGKLLLELVAGKLSTVVDTRISIVDIDDCARGHLLAAEKGVRLRRYLLNSFSMTTQEAVNLVEAVMGHPMKMRYLPPWVASLGGSLVGGLFSLVRRPAPICAEMVRTLLHGHVYDGSRAARELGLVYTPASETLRRLIGWAMREGLLDNGSNLPNLP